MDRDVLKRALLEQFVPYDTAVQKKLEYLQSDNVFADAAYDTVVQEDNLGDVSLVNAFNESSFSSQVPAYQSPTASNYAAPTENPENVPDKAQIDAHKQNIAARIAALRGISLPGGYIEK